MELNIIELYQLLAGEPEGFRLVLKNLYGGEILILRDLVKKALSFVEDEDGKNAARNRYIEDEMEDLADALKRVADFSSRFRYIVLNEMPLSCEYIRIRLMDLYHWTIESKEKFHEALKRDSEYFSDRTQDMEVFAKQKDEILTVLRRVDAVLEAIDENLKNK